MQDPQEAIANQLYGGLLVLAPVGTGKTHALTERVARALEAGFAPERILCLTFTNRAAREMQDRLATRFPRDVRRLAIRTFHGLCASVLRSEAKSAGLVADFTICDEADSLQLLREVGIRDESVARALYYQIGQRKSDVPSADLRWPPNPASLFGSLGDDRIYAERYQRELEQQNMLDFDDLVLLVNALFIRRPEIRARWEARYDFVQVDEVQDTHRSEYRVVWALARRSGNLALFGDLDQTIYGWRGSDPDAILERFHKDFAPVTQLSLELNHRATRRLVRAASSFADSFEHRSTRNLPAESSPPGAPISLHRAADAEAEGRWIGQRIRELKCQDADFAYRKAGVLTGTNRYGEIISRMLEQLDVPHSTVESFEFFRRQEVKDALAYPKLVVNPASTSAMIRVVERSVAGVGSGVMNRIRKAGEPLGLRLVDLLRPETFATGDPFGRLIDQYRHGSLTVFDLETTGLVGPGQEVVEIAATRLERGRARASFHTYLRNTIPVGASAGIHGLDDPFLAERGRPPLEALADFLAFCQDDLLVGHNVAFDLRVLTGHARRVGLPAPHYEYVDTLQLARRYVEAGSYRLDELARQLGLGHQPSHWAGDDVAATCDLLAALVPKAEARAADRRALVAREVAPFTALAEQLRTWRGLARSLRPAALLARILDESGLARHYGVEPRRTEHLAELVRVFAARDDLRLDPFSALCELLQYAALARNVDRLQDGDDRVPIITIHQAKGLEFDTVFIAGLFEGELPRRRSVDEGRLEEERRLFYVALTRARRRLYLSLSASSHYGKPTRPSQFLACIDPKLLQPS